jgi:hypothetical protein
VFVNRPLTNYGELRKNPTGVSAPLLDGLHPVQCIAILGARRCGEQKRGGG